MSTTRAIGRGVAWNTIGTTIGKVVVFANIFLILRHLSLYEYGLSELIFSVIASMSILLLPGLDSAVTADLAVERARGEYGRMKALFFRYLSVNMALAIFAWALLFFGSSYAAAFVGNPSIGYFLTIASWAFLLSPLRGMAQMLAAVEARFLDIALYSVVEEAVKGLLMLLFFFGLHMNIDGLLFAVVLSQLVAVLVYLPRTLSAYRVFGVAIAADGQVFWQILQHHRKWSIAVSYVNNLNKTLQLWIVRLLLGTEAVALYAFVIGILGQLTSFLPFNNVLTSLLPRYIDRRTDLARLFKASLKAQVACAGVIVVGGFIGIPVLFWLFPHYTDARLLLQVAFLTVFPMSIISMYTPLFNTLKAQFSYFLSAVWKTVISTILLWAGATLFGVLGMGIAIVLGYSATALERTIRLRHLAQDLAPTSRDFIFPNSEERFFLRQAYQLLRTRGILSFFR